MSGPIELTIRRARAFAVIATVALTGSALATPAFARGPENIADVAEKVIDAVVNISTTQNVAARSGGLRRAQRDAAAAAGFAVPGILRRVLQEPPAG